jgi:hypothetical protein
MMNLKWPAVRLTLFIVALSTPLAAQWPSHGMPGLPKTPDGKPNLTAPAPRTADGKPDLSGIWDTVASPVGPVEPAVGDAPPGATYFNVAAGMKGPLPLTPAGAEIMKQRAADHFKNYPNSLCLPVGIMQIHTHPQPRKILQMPGVILTIAEANLNVRQIFTDGRPLPRNNPQPWWYGYSVGKWDGDTLVVDTNNLRDGGWLDVNTGAPLTDAATLTERFRRVNYGRLEVDVTVNDPKAYTKPWTVRIAERLLPNTELIEHVCLDGQELTRPQTWR